MGLNKEHLLLEELKFNIREKDYPFFSDGELITLLRNNRMNVKKASYKALMMKAEESSFNFKDISEDSSHEYFMRLARMYRGNQGRILTREG